MAAGQKLGSILKIDYGFSEIRVYHPTYSLGSECLCEEGVAAPDLEPQALRLTDRVNITWQIEESEG